MRSAPLTLPFLRQFIAAAHAGSRMRLETISALLDLLLEGSISAATHGDSLVKAIRRCYGPHLEHEPLKWHRRWYAKPSLMSSLGLTQHVPELHTLRRLVRQMLARGYTHSHFAALVFCAVPDGQTRFQLFQQAWTCGGSRKVRQDMAYLQELETAGLIRQSWIPHRGGKKQRVRLYHTTTKGLALLTGAWLQPVPATSPLKQAA